MRKPIIITAAVIAVLALAGITYWLLSKPEEIKPFDPAFREYIAAYTSGTVSRQEVIRLRLNPGVNTLHPQNGEEKQELFDFKPGIKGSSRWVDERTVEFIPDNPLEPSRLYNARFHLGKVSGVPDERSVFEFQFQVVPPYFETDFEGLKAFNASSANRLTLAGNLYFSDTEPPEQIEKILNVEYQGKKLPVRWEHNTSKRSSRFSVDSIIRGKEARELRVSWDGKPVRADIRDSKAFEVPAVGDFKILDIKAIQAPEQYLSVLFSDPVRDAQDLTGLLGISGMEDFRYTVEGSEVKVYAPEQLEGSYAVFVNEGVENMSGEKLRQGMSANVTFETRLPSVKIPGTGTILPGSDKLTLPFEAVNLKAVDVSIIKIYEDNIPQFLQENDPDGDYELRRVGKPVLQKIIRLDDDKNLDLTRKNRFSLDIDPLLQAEPGAIYHVTIGFRRSYSLYNCAAVAADRDEETGNGRYYYAEQIDEDDNFWNRYNDYYPFGYNWEERDDPCSDAFYTKERWASRNIMTSDIGLIAKRGSLNELLITATDLLSARPMAGVEVQALDYQQQVIEKATTGRDGQVRMELERRPFLLLAGKDGQRGYLKLDDGSSLPLSRFDVGGDVVQQGIKGFLYGERGVWRPGDTIYTGFILEDKEGHLPKNHPVTFELYNPRGQLAARMVQTTSLNGFYTFKAATDATAPTGNWSARVKVGGAEFGKSLKVETVRPNRLKIGLDFGDQQELQQGREQTAALSARWLFGATARNLKARVDVTLTPGRTSFEKFTGYLFDDQAGSFETESKTVFDGPLSEQGTARVQTGLSASGKPPGILKANLAVRVFEPGGNFSIDNFSMPYHVYSSYAGIRVPEGDELSGMLLTDRDHPVELVNVNPKGELISGTRKVEIELYKIRWKWWWDQQQENLSNFTQDSYNKLLQNEVVTLQNGKGKWNLRIDYPDWGRYLLRVKDLESGHITGKTVYIDWPGWAQREQQENPTEASMLSFTADKDHYQVGEEVTLTIPSGKNGRGLISIENGSRVLKSWWIDTEPGQTTHTFTVEEEMTPNVFINVTLLQPHAQTANDLPIRMYGVIPLLVEDPQTILKPEIGLPQVLRPETESAITVSERTGKPMTYTIAIVDEGLLDLTRFKTPDPHTSFYAREALGVKTWDLFDQVIGAWGGELERLLSIGGDVDINRNINPAKANRFKPVVKFMGPFSLEKNRKRTHKFTLPQYIGSVRAMVVAGQNGAYGFGEKTAEVKNPLMLLPTLPRVAGPGETFRLPITVFATEPSLQQVTVEVQGNELLSLSNAKQSIRFSEPGEKMIYADVQVGEAAGVARLKVIARSGNEQTEHETELDVRNPNPFITDVNAAEVTGGASWSTEIGPIGTGQNHAVVEVSSLPPMNLTKRLNYLIRYPHGCVEQITSSVFPQLTLSYLSDLSESRKASVERNVKAGIHRLRGYQLADGGLGYWPGASRSDEWSTNYAGHFMLQAQARGYALPAGFLDAWRRYQQNQASNWTPQSRNYYGSDLTQAYRLYLLALAKSPDMAAMNRLKEYPQLSDAAKWRLAAAYGLVGQGVIAHQLIRGLPTRVRAYKQLGGTYGSDLRDQAMILETLTELGEDKRAADLLAAIASRLSADEWYSTQTTAYALIAIAGYAGQSVLDSKLQFDYTLDGKKQTVDTESYLHRIPVDLSSDKPAHRTGGHSFTLDNTGTGRLYTRVIREGQAPPGEDPPVRNRPDMLDMKIRYTNLSGRAIDPSRLKQGTDFIAEVTLRNPGNRGNYQQMALTQIFPSGWEIINTRLADNEEALKSSPSDYQDIRDDRVLTYFNLPAGKTVTYRILLNASYLGRYYLPARSAEAMYDNAIQATSPGGWVEVTE